MEVCFPKEKYNFLYTTSFNFKIENSLYINIKDSVSKSTRIP